MQREKKETQADKDRQIGNGHKGDRQIYRYGGKEQEEKVERQREKNIKRGR